MSRRKKTKGGEIEIPNSQDGPRREEAITHSRVQINEKGTLVQTMSHLYHYDIKEGFESEITASGRDSSVPANT